jgi:hypothetical protein
MAEVMSGLVTKMTWRLSRRLRRAEIVTARLQKGALSFDGTFTFSSEHHRNAIRFRRPVPVKFVMHGDYSYSNFVADVKLRLSMTWVRTSARGSFSLYGKVEKRLPVDNES